MNALCQTEIVEIIHPPPPPPLPPLLLPLPAPAKPAHTTPSFVRKKTKQIARIPRTWRTRNASTSAMRPAGSRNGDDVRRRSRRRERGRLRHESHTDQRAGALDAGADAGADAADDADAADGAFRAVLNDDHCGVHPGMTTLDYVRNGCTSVRCCARDVVSSASVREVTAAVAKNDRSIYLIALLTIGVLLISTTRVLYGTRRWRGVGMTAHPHLSF